MQIMKRVCDNCKKEIIDDHWYGDIELNAYNGRTISHVRIDKTKDYCSFGCIIETVIQNVGNNNGNTK